VQGRRNHRIKKKEVIGMVPFKKQIESHIESQNILAETVILIPLVPRESKDTKTHSEAIVKMTTTSVGFYRLWQANFYWSEFGSITQAKGS